MTRDADRPGAAEARVDVRCLTIEALAAGEAAAVDYTVDLITERDSYRLLAQRLLHTLHQVLQERDHFARRHQRLIEARCASVGSRGDEPHR